MKVTSSASTVFITMPYKYMEERSPLEPADIVFFVAEYYEVKIDDIIGQWRKREVVLARHMAMDMLDKFTELGLQEIGDMFQGRDHTTVIHAKHTINDLCDTDPKIYKDREYLILKIKRNVNKQI